MYGSVGKCYYYGMSANVITTTVSPTLYRHYEERPLCRNLPTVRITSALNHKQALLKPRTFPRFQKDLRHLPVA